MNETGGKYIGTYVDYTETDSTDKTKYKWVLVKGSQGDKGDQGIAGVNGVDGKTSYLHIAYANSADGITDFSVSDSENKLYIGQYTDFTLADSTDYRLYKWTLIKGADGSSMKFAYKYADSKPDIPNDSTMSANGWSESSDLDELNSINYQHIKSYLTTNSKEINNPWIFNSGWFQSPSGVSSSSAYARISFITTKANQTVKLLYDVSSESKYDYLYVGNLDATVSTSSYKSKLSGTNSGTLSFTASSAGTHYIELMYVKDASGNTGRDNARVKIDYSTTCWISHAIYTNNSTDGWSDPVLFTSDTSKNEYIYWLTHLDISPIAPSSQIKMDDAEPALALSSSYSTVWSSGTVIAKGTVFFYGGHYYEATDNITSSDTSISSKSEQLNDWKDDPQTMTAKYKYIWVCSRSKVNGIWGDYSTPTLWAKYSNDGKDGTDADIYEYRYAKNGSTSTPPELDTTALNPTGWTTTIPTLAALEYLWLTIAKKNAAGTSLITNWSKPIRTNGADGAKGDKGDKGENPVLVFRGVYDASKTYYGNNTRLEAVKYNGVYYITRIDAGSFSGTLPTATAKWNTFGAELETIATNLLLAEGANIGDWFMSGGKIVSTLSSGNKITLDASMAEILIESSDESGSYSMNNFGSKITLNANNGIVEVEAKNAPLYSTGTAYMSPNGVFANLAGTNALPASSGYTHRGAIVGLGFANVNGSTWDSYNQTIVAGVYGRALNSGTAPAFGGYFENLMASGMFLYRRAVTDTDGIVYLNDTDSLIVGYNSNTKNVYLPTSTKQGQQIIALQWRGGEMHLYPRGGQKLYHGTSIVDYFTIVPGEVCFCFFVIGYFSGTKTEAWVCSSFKTGA